MIQMLSWQHDLCFCDPQLPGYLIMQLTLYSLAYFQCQKTESNQLRMPVPNITMVSQLIVYDKRFPGSHLILDLSIYTNTHTVRAT